MPTLSLARLAIAVLLVAPSAARAQDAVDNNAAVVDLVRGINANAEIRSIAPSPIPGIKTVVADSSVLYVSEDGRYLLYGVLLDTKAQRNLTDEALSASRKVMLESVEDGAAIVFSPPDPQYTVTVFTDTTCGYCRTLHANIQGYLDAGIRIEYLPWPRGGAHSESASALSRVWCAKDRVRAYEQEMQREAGVPPADAAPSSCAASEDVARFYALGTELGIEGTPTLFSADGRRLGGYLTPDALLAKLKVPGLRQP